MGHYTKLAILAMRTMGLLILFYAGPMILFGVLHIAAGARTASDGVTSSASALVAWVVYGVAGLLLVLLAKPLGRLAARGLDAAGSGSPAA